MKIFNLLFKKEKKAPKEFKISDEVIEVGDFDVKSKLQIIPVEDTKSLYLNLDDDNYVAFMERIEEKYGDAYLNGYGIESVLKRYLELNNPDMLEGIEFDSEASTFVAVFDKDDKNIKEIEKIVINLFTGSNMDEFILQEYSNIDWM